MGERPTPKNTTPPQSPTPKTTQKATEATVQKRATTSQSPLSKPATIQSGTVKSGTNKSGAPTANTPMAKSVTTQMVMDTASGDPKTPAQYDQKASSEPRGLLDKLKAINGFKKIGRLQLAQTTDIPQEIGSENKTVSAPRTRREMIERVIAFDEKRVFDVMMPRADIAAVELDTSMNELIQVFSKEGHSRMPVYRGDLDDPLGMVHIKDLIEMIAEKGESENHDKAILNDLLRKVLYVPPSMRVVDLFLRMQASRIHMALVIDEYGGTDGLVTIEDLVEQIVGEINDEHDDDEGPLIQKRDHDCWDADARAELQELTDTIGFDLSEDEDEVGTLGGLVVSLAGRVPLRGEVISHTAGFEFEVLEADARRIRKILIRLVKDKKTNHHINN